MILMWVYYASVILFFGAEFTQVYAKATGTKARPAKYAVPVAEENKAQQGIPRGKTGEEHRTRSRDATNSEDRERAESKTAPRKGIQNDDFNFMWLMFYHGRCCWRCVQVQTRSKASKALSRGSVTSADSDSGKDIMKHNSAFRIDWSD